MNGIINVYKEQGYTSHDVVAKLRGILNMKKIGHTGTLDPEAVGVLPVCIGKATKLCDMITDWNKTYEAVMLLGVTTDTQDTTGQIISECEVNVSEVDILEACNSFVGEYNQIPPMYSALKHNGKKLYELARAGIEIEREPRKVTIKSIHINDIDLEDKGKKVTFTVECSKGTYIRTLCEDIGKKLGCGACMMKLIRTRVGCFGLDQSITVNEIAAHVLKGDLSDYVKNIDDMFETYRKIVIKPDFDKLLYNGNKLPFSAVVQEDEDIQLLDMEKYRVYDKDNKFIGVYGYESGGLFLIKMFYEA